MRYQTYQKHLQLSLCDLILRKYSLRFVVQRQIDREDTSNARHITDSQDTPVCFDTASLDVQPQPKPRSVLSALGKRQKHVVRSASRQPATLVFDFDQYAVAHHMGMQTDV